MAFFRIYGFTTVKVKLGKDLDDAIKRIRLARQILGNATTLRVDANCAWSVPETLEFAQRAEAYNIASIEQPIKGADFGGLLQLASSIPQAIVLDESLCTINQAKYFANKSSKVDFNIRLSKMGGLIAASRIRKIAKQNNIKCHLGAQVGESGILTQAARIFGMNKGPFINCEGAANSFLLKQDLTKENLTFGYAGIGKSVEISNVNSYGLGITVEENQLFNLLKREIMINQAAKVLVSR